VSQRPGSRKPAQRTEVVGIEQAWRGQERRGVLFAIRIERPNPGFRFDDRGLGMRARGDILGDCAAIAGGVALQTALGAEIAALSISRCSVVNGLCSRVVTLRSRPIGISDFKLISASILKLSSAEEEARGGAMRIEADQASAAGRIVSFSSPPIRNECFEAKVSLAK
jgi:hypothetical protein